MQDLEGGRATSLSIEEKVKEVGLEGKLHSYAKILSGGQKRKLCAPMLLLNQSIFFLCNMGYSVHYNP